MLSPQDSGVKPFHTVSIGDLLNLMHLLVIAKSFPSPQNPDRVPFIGEQVRLLSQRVERITVLSPTTFVPRLMRRFRRCAAIASLPDRYQFAEGRCEVLFPRYLKPPGSLLLRWTTAQWCRMVDKAVTRFARMYPVSIIHAHVGGVSAWAAVCAAIRHQIPCVVTYHGSEVHTTLARRRKGWQLCYNSFRLADLNLPVSLALEAILRQHAQPTNRCETMLLGVDQERFFPPIELSKAPRVLFVGRVARAKGIFDLLSAWKSVRVTCPEAFLTVVGPDHSGGLFLQQVRSLGLHNSIRLTGPLPNPAIAELMRKSRLLCLPSYREGTPVCVMEALASGLPVVATRVGGISNIVKHEKSGFLISEGDIGGLADALACLLRDHHLCARMGRVAQVFARQYLDGRKTADRLVTLYKDLIADYPEKNRDQRLHRTHQTSVPIKAEALRASQLSLRGLSHFP